MKKTYILTFLICLAILVSCGKESKQSVELQELGTTPVQKENEHGEIEVDGVTFSYLKKDDGVWIQGCENEPKELVIPEELVGERVVGLGTYAFSEKTIEKVVLPESVTVIGDRAFLECKNLHTIIIEGENVKTTTAAFIGCTNLKIVEKKRESHNILFLGNSLTSTAAVPSHMQSILKECGKTEYNVMASIKVGLGLPAHLEDASKTGVDVALKLADVVVIQDAYISSESREWIQDLYERCGEDVELYYWFTDWMDKGRRNLFTNLFAGYCGIKILDSGNLFDTIVKEEKVYTEKEMWMKDHNHPNPLYGYFTTMYIFHEIFGEDVRQLTDLDYLNTDVSDWLTTGNSDAEMEKVRKVQDIIQQ